MDRHTDRCMDIRTDRKSPHSTKFERPVVTAGHITLERLFYVSTFFYFSFSPWIPLDGPPDPQIALKTAPADPSTGPPDLPAGPQDPQTGISDPLNHQLGSKYTLGADIA